MHPAAWLLVYLLICLLHVHLHLFTEPCTLCHSFVRPSCVKRVNTSGLLSTIRYLCKLELISALTQAHLPGIYLCKYYVEQTAKDTCLPRNVSGIILDSST